LIYLYAPEGIGRSKMVEKLGRAIKADMTARNLNTVETLKDMAAELSSLQTARLVLRAPSLQ
jgi:uncharacterized protein (DUF1697 family)